MTELGGTYHLGDRDVPRVGYGAMRLPGRGVSGPAADHGEAIAVLRTAVELGVRHIDTASFYGPRVAGPLIREALAPYPDDLVIVTKVGVIRDAKGGWPTALGPDQLRQQIEWDLEDLGVDVLDVVNLRMPTTRDGRTPAGGSLAAPFEALAALQQEGLVRDLGVSSVDAQQVAEARTIAPVVCVQNLYNLAQRGDDDLIDRLADDEIAYVPYFPLGGFSPLQQDELQQVARDLGVAASAAATAWLLQRSPNVLLIPGTSSVAHLRENLSAGSLELPEDAVSRLTAIA